MMQQGVLEVPMLGTAGVAGDTELNLARRFDDLHQLLYSRGGIRPTNAAIEEVAKLIYLRLWASRAGAEMTQGGSVIRLFRGDIPSAELVPLAKAAFMRANLDPHFGAMDRHGKVQPLWPEDEPFRLDHADVLASALSLIDEIVSSQTDAVSDPLGIAFDAFLSGRYEHSGGLGTYLTPSSIARAMADIALDIADPLSGRWDRRAPFIADPYCGTGRFLVAAFEAVESRIADRGLLQDLLEYGLLGADQSATATAKTAINLMLYGATAPHVFRVEDSVTATVLDELRGSVRLILTNPPFGGGKYVDSEGIRRTSDRIPSVAGKAGIDPALACTVRALELLAPGGVLGIVLPDGIVDGRQFEELIGGKSDVTVVANLSLPTTTFSLSGTVAKTSAVFLQKRARVTRTVLARVEHVGFIRQAGKAARDPSGTQVPDVVAGVQRALRVEESADPLVEISHSPLVASIAAGALQSLDPSRIDPGAMASRRRLAEAGGVPLRGLLRTRRKEAQKRTDSSLPFVSVLHVDDLGIVSWPDAERYAPTTPGQVAYAGEVIVSLLNPSKLRAAVVPARYPRIICSTEFGVFKPLVDPNSVLALLHHPDVQAQLRPLGRGTSSSRRRIGAVDIMDLLVPNLSSGDLATLGRTISFAIQQVEQGREILFQNYG